MTGNKTLILGANQPSVAGLLDSLNAKGSANKSLKSIELSSDRILDRAQAARAVYQVECRRERRGAMDSLNLDRDKEIGVNVPAERE